MAQPSRVQSFGAPLWTIEILPPLHDTPRSPLTVPNARSRPTTVTLLPRAAPAPRCSHPRLRSPRAVRTGLLLACPTSTGAIPDPILLRALPCSRPPVSDKRSTWSSAAWAAVQFNGVLPASGLNHAATAPCCALGRTAEEPCAVGVIEACEKGSEQMDPSVVQAVPLLSSWALLISVGGLLWLFGTVQLRRRR